MAKRTIPQGAKGRMSSGSKKKRRQRLASKSSTNSFKQGKNPVTGKEFFILKKGKNNVLQIVSSWQTRAGAVANRKEGEYIIVNTSIKAKMQKESEKVPMYKALKKTLNEYNQKLADKYPFRTENKVQNKINKSLFFAQKKDLPSPPKVLIFPKGFGKKAV